MVMRRRGKYEGPGGQVAPSQGPGRRIKAVREPGSYDPPPGLQQLHIRATPHPPALEGELATQLTGISPALRP